MNLKKYILGVVLVAGMVTIACRDESLYPLPYDDRTSGHYLRIYKVTSNVLEFNDLANSAVEFVFESVDEEKGALLEEVEFYATHRNGGTGLITDEVLVTTIPASAMNLAAVPQPTYSEYLRSGAVRITAAQIQTALATLTTDPDGIPGVDCSNIYPDVCPCVAYPGSLALGDQILLRWKARLTDGRTFTVANAQTVTSPSLGNPEEANMTPNVTAGQFYNAPYFYTITVRQATNPFSATAYTGTYRMTQMAVWSPNHNLELHQSIPNYMVKPFIFGSSATDSTQTVTLATVPGGLPTERQFTCTYRGQTITMRINLEGGPNPGLPAAALTTLTSAFGPPGPGNGMGMAGATNANLGTVFVPLINSGVDCTSQREFYMVTPLAGTFAGNNTLRFGLPRYTIPNRGYYRIDQDGLTPGQVFTIAVDDDADEYGRRNGYCTWFRRVYLRLEKLP
ncbi:MAG: hypothetical protein L6Q51_09355 [Cyclobacteriaceae bacterium]|nr:hypothetical protein [Cyclobacteriaceae bacterium]QOI96019.1 MAG: hypothetical protein HRU69_00360 [Flammeovirgaceae bacterium]